MLGGYIAGRMRSSWHEGGPDEVAFRDGMHGFLVWSLGIVASALLVMLTSITTAEIGARSPPAPLRKATRFSRPLDTLLRPSMTAAASNAATPQLDRDEVARILVTLVANAK